MGYRAIHRPTRCSSPPTVVARNGYRAHLCNVELQRLGDEIGVPLTVCPFPAGTSKWNKIEHWLFSFATTNWSGKPPRDYQAVVNLIASTETGLKVRGELDDSEYQKSRKFTDPEMASLNIPPHDCRGDRNEALSLR